MHGAIKWLEGMDGELWLYQAKALRAEDAMAIDTILRPFIEAAKCDLKFANFFLMLVQKWEEKYQIDPKGITVMELLTDIREELATIVAKFKANPSNEECGCAIPV